MARIRYAVLTLLGWHRVLPPIAKPPLRTVVPPQTAISMSKRRLVPSVCVQGIQPLCVQALYNLPTTPATVPNNGIAVSGFLGGVANQIDLTVCRFVFGPSALTHTEPE